MVPQTNPIGCVFFQGTPQTGIGFSVGFCQKGGGVPTPKKRETEPTSGLCATSPAWSRKRETSCRATAGWMRTASAPPARKPGRCEHETHMERRSHKMVGFQEDIPSPQKRGPSKSFPLPPKRGPRKCASREKGRFSPCARWPQG